VEEEEGEEGEEGDEGEEGEESSSSRNSVPKAEAHVYTNEASLYTKKPYTIFNSNRSNR
jgi:hypothetical protein